MIIDSYIWRRWRAGDLMCRLNPEMTVAFTGCTLWHTALIAIHRYFVVVHGDAYHRISKRAYTVFVLVVARVVPYLCVLPGIARGFDGVGYIPKLLRCVLLADQRDRIMLVTTVLTIVPCVVVVLCYCRVILYVLVSTCRTKLETARRELRITAIFGAIFLVVIGGFTPYSVVRSIDRRYELDADIYLAVSVCYSVATCSSPLVYGALSTQIRQACGDVLTDFASLCRRTERPPVSPTTGHATAGAPVDRCECVQMHILADVEGQRTHHAVSRLVVVAPSNYASL